MNVQISFGDSAEFKLQRALLLYTQAGSTRQRHAATVHDITCENGAPVIQPGQPLTVAGVETLTRELSGDLGGAFLPENVLGVGFGRMGWWCPASRNRIWFKTREPELDALNGKLVWHPPLLFIAANGGLTVFALPKNERPTPKTKLLRAPYYNMSDSGVICRGSARLPEVPTPANLADFERGFFNSAFTHSNVHGDRLVAKGHTHERLWLELSKRSVKPDDRYWKQRLVRVKNSIPSLLKGNYDLD